MSIRSRIYNAALRTNTRGFISWGLISRLASKRPHNKLWEGRLVDAPDPATPSRYTASTRRLGLQPAMLADDRISRRSSLSALSVILRLARPEGPRDRWLPSRPISRDGIWPAGTSLSKLSDRLRRTSLPEVLHCGERRGFLLDRGLLGHGRCGGGRGRALIPLHPLRLARHPAGEHLVHALNRNDIKPTLDAVRDFDKILGILFGN